MNPRFELQEERDGAWVARGRYRFIGTAQAVLDSLAPHTPNPLRVWDHRTGEPIT